jgi:folylpolyglutamate synthase
MKHKAVTVISKIGLDHQEYLGNTIENIAKVKAGIMKKGVPCIVDHTNIPSVIHVLREHARSIGTDIILTWKGEPLLMSLDNSKWKLESYQVQNLLCAAMAFRQLFPLQQINFDKLLATGPFLPGRLETVRVDPPASGVEARDILVDGAHNMLGIETLAEHVNKRLRTPEQPVTWVMGMSASKDKPLLALIEKLVQPHDNFAMVEFTRGPNDPQPAPANYGTDHARTFLQTPEQVYDGEPDISSALPWACDKANGGPVVVTGSLYLIRQLLSLKGIRRTRELGTRRPGRSQLYRYTKLAREGKLTRAEQREFKEARRHFELSPKRSRVFSDQRERGFLQPRNKRVPKKIRSLQREVAFHANQRRGYEQTIKALTKDLSELDKKKKNPEPESPVANLSARIDDLKIQVAQHKEKHSETMTQLRGYEAIPHMKYKTHTQIFGYPKKPKAPTQSPFKVVEEAAKSKSKKGKPVMTWKDRRESFTEEVAAAEKERAMATREAARRVTKASADPFKEKFAGGRRVS